MSTKTILIRYSVLFWISACAPATVLDTPDVAKQKINFDLSGIDEQGLMGPADGRVAIAYIFYIPLEESKQKEVKEIDSSVRFFERKNENRYQCIGESGGPSKIIRLAQLPYIKKINRFYGE